MGGEYKANVFARVRTREECTAIVDQCGSCGKVAPKPSPAPEPSPSPPPGPAPGPEPPVSPQRRRGSAIGKVECGEVYTGSLCGKMKAGWSCPPDGGCPGGDCTGQWKEYVEAHNIYRCMHDLSPVVWSEAVYQDVAKTFENQRETDHSDSFSIAAPAGPAGENLYQSSWSSEPSDALAAWYTEMEDCGAFPGCKSGASGTTGHFTVMTWNGAQEIGCTKNQYSIVACRYKGGDKASCRTPNMQGHFSTNVFAAVRTQEKCTAMVKKCAIGGGGCSAGAKPKPVPTPAPTPAKRG